MDNLILDGQGRYRPYQTLSLPELNALVEAKRRQVLDLQAQLRDATIVHQLADDELQIRLVRAQATSEED